MANKGKKKLAKKSSPLNPRRRESLPFYGDHCYSEGHLFEIENSVRNLETKCKELMAAVDCGGSSELLNLLSLYMAELEFLKARIRDAQTENKNPNIHGNGKGRAGHVSLVAQGATRKFDHAICSVEENQYYDHLWGYVDMWNALSVEGRKEGRKSLIEVLESDGGGDEELRASVFEMLIDIGIKISSLMAEYFSLFVGTLEDSEILMRSRVMKSTLLIESLHNVFASPVIDRFVKVVDSAIGRIRVSADKDVKAYQFLFGKRESELLGSIFLKVLYLEVAFCCPSVPEKLENKDLMSIKDYIAKLFDEKLGKLSSEMNEFKKRCETSDIELSSKRSELKEALDSEIREIWKGYWTNCVKKSTNNFMLER